MAVDHKLDFANSVEDRKLGLLIAARNLENFWGKIATKNADPALDLDATLADDVAVLREIAVYA